MKMKATTTATATATATTSTSTNPLHLRPPSFEIRIALVGYVR